MIPLACFLLLAASRVDVTDEVYQIPASDWRYIEISLNRRAALVSARYSVIGPGEVRLALLPRDDLRQLRAGETLDDFEPTPASRGGQMKRHTREPGGYVLAIENRSPAAVSVRVRVTLDFPVARQISPERQFVVIAISCLAFFAVVGYSARRLLRAVRRS